MSKILDLINNKIGMFFGAAAIPPPGSKTFTVTCDMTFAESQDVTDTLQLSVWADFGTGLKEMAVGPVWTCGPGKPIHSFAWNFRPEAPPLRVVGALSNITQVKTGLFGDFT